MEVLMPFYIGTIQLSLLLLTFLVWWCELTPLFSNSLKSILLRFTISMSLLILGCYAHYLALVPIQVTFSFFVLIIASTFYIAKKLMHTYSTRKERIEDFNGKHI